MREKKKNSIAQHLRCLFDHSEMPKPKFVIRFFSSNDHPGLSRLRSQKSGIRKQDIMCY